MRTLQTMFFLALMMMFGPARAEVSFKQFFDLSSEQVDQFEQQAGTGDVAAITTLISYYQFSAPDEQRALYWMERGAALDDPSAMLNLSSRLASRSTKADCRDAERLLLKVLGSSAGDGLKSIALFQLDSLRNRDPGSGSCGGWLVED